MTDAGIDIDVVEDCDSFVGNAEKKALEISRVSGKLTLSDDSGLVIDYLDGMPGVYSARYMGEKTPYIEKNTKILEIMEKVPFRERSARFVCVVAAAVPLSDGTIKLIHETGIVEGYIHTRISGENGFGYDPIFFVPEYGVTTAEMSGELKNKISHRGIALRRMKQRLAEIL